MNLIPEKLIIDADERFVNSLNQTKHSGNDGVNRRIVGAGDYPDSEQILDGFLAGLSAEVVDVESLEEVEYEAEPQPTPEEILEEARREAEQIIATAKAEALQIETEAQRQADMLYERRKHEGYKDGVSKLQDELIERSEAMQMDYQEKERLLKNEYNQKMDALENDMVDIMIQVFHKVFHVQFDNKKQILMHLIKDTLLGIDAGKHFIIRVAECNYKFIESHVADIKEKIGNDVTIDIVKDALLEESDCMIETETGIYNCGIEMVLSNLEKDIKSLCR